MRIILMEADLLILTELTQKSASFSDLTGFPVADRIEDQLIQT